MVWPPPRIQATPEGEVTGDAPAVPQNTSAAEVPVPHAAAGSSAALHAGATQGAGVPHAPSTLARDWLSRPEALIGTVLGGRYRITGLLGRGPMGIACEGESSRGRHVTLKLLPRPAELPVEHFAWQVRQTLALAHFDHPNVSPMSDFGALDDGSAFVSRGHFSGLTLRELASQGPMPVRRALELARQVAQALAAAHAQDIAHGRLKPENILVQSQPRGADLVKVVDFGMAELPVNVQAVAPDATEARRLALRTWLYLPSGSASSGNPAADLYSLGVILFELIAGQPPFPWEAIGPMGPLAPPRGFAQCQPPVQVPPAVADLVMSLLRPEAAQQGMTAAHLVAVLEAFLGHPSEQPPEPVTSQRPSAPPAPSFAENASPVAPAQRPAQPVAHAASFPPPSGGIVPSWPPLPQGFSPSSIPPPPQSSESSRPSSPFGVASGSYPPNPPAAAAPATLNGSAAPSHLAPELDDADAEFRPSLIARLRRLFQRPKRSGF